MTMFADQDIDYREYLSDIDYAEAEKLVRNGMPFDQALDYLRGWAEDYAIEAEIESKADRDFVNRAYGRPNE